MYDSNSVSSVVLLMYIKSVPRRRCVLGDSEPDPRLINVPSRPNWNRQCTTLDSFMHHTYVLIAAVVFIPNATSYTVYVLKIRSVQ
jgi:hypothetical protein